MKSKGLTSGFEVWVEKDEQSRFNEYRISHAPATKDQPATTTCWLESEMGAHFTVCAKRLFPSTHHLRKKDTSMVVYVDGRIISEPAWLASSKYSVVDTAWIKHQKGISHGLLTFTAAQTTEDPSAVTLPPSAQYEIGTIVVTLTPGTYSEETDDEEICTMDDAPVVVLESDKKLGVGIAFSKVEDEVEPVSYYSFTPVKKYEDVPFHRFIFMYRPRVVLQLRGVIRSDPVSTPQAVLPPPQPPCPVLKRKREESLGAINSMKIGDEDEKPTDYIQRLEKRIKYLEGIKLGGKTSPVEVIEILDSDDE